MRGLLSDHNIHGQVAVLATILESPAWRELWSALQLTVLTFSHLGLDRESSDRTIWEICQQQQVILLTANRNNDGPDSLEATIQALHQPDSLPVFTLADANRIMRSRDYAEQTAVRLLEYLLNIDLVRGSGRLFLP